MEEEVKGNVQRPCGESPRWEQPFYNAEQQPTPPPPPSPPPIHTLHHPLCPHAPPLSSYLITSILPASGRLTRHTPGLHKGTAEEHVTLPKVGGGGPFPSMHLRENSPGWINMQFIELMCDIALLSSTACRHGMRNVGLELSFFFFFLPSAWNSRHAFSYQACSYL